MEQLLDAAHAAAATAYASAETAMVEAMRAASAARRERDAARREGEDKTDGREDRLEQAESGFAWVIVPAGELASHCVDAIKDGSPTLDEFRLLSGEALTERVGNLGARYGRANGKAEWKFMRPGAPLLHGEMIGETRLDPHMAGARAFRDVLVAAGIEAKVHHLID